MIRRRQTSVFSLAFLDCICCGFGAIILIFVLSIDSKQKEKLQTLLEVQRALAAQLAELQKLKASREDLDRANARVATLVTDARLRNDSIHALLDDLEGALQKEKKGQEALLVDIDELKKEIAARQKKPDLNLLPEVKPAPLGLPVGSNYIPGTRRASYIGGVVALAVQTVAARRVAAGDPGSDPEGLARLGLRAATGARTGASRTYRQITASVTRPGTTASRKRSRSRPGNSSRKSIAASGPNAAPEVGNCVLLKNVPVGLPIHNIETRRCIHTEMHTHYIFQVPSKMSPKSISSRHWYQTQFIISQGLQMSFV